jgi:peptidoglycan/LPS O-acetylase OafA/YrhL
MVRASETVAVRHARLLRALALVAALVLPVAWLVSLRSEPDFLWANLFRVIGALLAAAGTWALRRRREGRGASSWQSLLAAGVVGSLAVSVLSLPIPALGRITASGWLMSGVVGGGMLALALYAVRGGTGHRGP